MTQHRKELILDLVRLLCLAKLLITLARTLFQQ